MNPPNVVLVTRPNAQRTMSMIATVINIILVLSVEVILKCSDSAFRRRDGLSCGVFDMVADFFDVVTETMNGSATAAKECC